MKRSRYKESWPIDNKARRPPENWPGWPGGKRFALVLTHDVDTARGQRDCYELIKVEQKLGFRSCFFFVPERYSVSTGLRRYLIRNGFEIGVHGLYHDGKLYNSREIFKSRSEKINRYLREWNAAGFRSPAMQNNLDWIHDLNITYDASTYDTAIFETHTNGIGTIFPLWVSANSNRNGYVELPYTLPQDFYLFVLMKEKNIDIWKKKLDWIADNGGMALLNTHPDYMNFDAKKKMSLDQYPVEYYAMFLEYIRNHYSGQYWAALPKIVAEHLIKMNLKG